MRTLYLTYNYRAVAFTSAFLALSCANGATGGPTQMPAACSERTAESEQAGREYHERLRQLDERSEAVLRLRADLQRAAGDRVKVAQRRNTLRIIVPATVLVGDASTALSPTGIETLTAIAELIAREHWLKRRSFQVWGHTIRALGDDAFGKGFELALLVRNFLAAPERGLEGARWSAASYGALDPHNHAASRDKAEDIRINARVEIVLVPAPEEMLVYPDPPAPAASRQPSAR